MRDLRREIDIDAPPSAVWAVLTNTGSYLDWNPFIRRVESDLGLPRGRPGRDS